MNLPQIFMYEGRQVRTVLKNGEPWFVAKDVCDVLELGNTGQAISRLDDDEKADITLNDGSQNRSFSTVNEPGLYSLILGSRKTEAKQFKRWVTHEVLPSIRKTGAYSVNQLPQNYKEALIALIEQVDKTEQLQMQLTESAPKVALYDTAMNAKNNFTMERVSKTLGYGRNKLFQFLRETKILRDNNLPYQEYLDRGYFDVRQYSVTHFTSGIENKTQTLVTAKGMAYIHKLLIENGKVTA